MNVSNEREVNKMLKDYSTACISESGRKNIEEFLQRQACFPTYSKAYSYIKRVQSSGKIFRWKDNYYEVSEQFMEKMHALKH